MTDQFYMRKALEQAEKGIGFTHPNPVVGCVIVKDGKIIGGGYHQRYGGSHAERNALADCTQPLDSAVLYVTLEPCCHHGKTPPCTEAIIQSGIKKVVIGAVDPNPLVGGKGIDTLRNSGIEVVTGVLEKECIRINEVFFHYIQTKTPFVVMKYAMTLDGKIAAYTGESKWITGEEAREQVQRFRHIYDGIMVGVDTVIQDDPLLTCRLPGMKNPKRIVCDTHLRIPSGSQIVRTAREVPTYIATCSSDSEKAAFLSRKGVHILNMPDCKQGVDLKELMLRLGEEKIDSILLEGGGTLNFSALQDGIVQKAYIFIAPKILGGKTAKSPVGGIGLEHPDLAFRLTDRKVHFYGEDILLEYKVSGR